MENLNFKRTMVVGCAGCGKTTFTLELSKILDRQPIHLDKELWQPNWVLLPYDERKILHDKLIEQDSWIIDGMWRSHVDDRISRATTVILLAFPRRVCMWRAFWRAKKYRNKSRFDLAEGCPEKFDREFRQYIWDFNKKYLPEILQIIEREKEHLDVVVLKNPKQAKKWLRALNFKGTS